MVYCEITSSRMEDTVPCLAEICIQWKSRGCCGDRSSMVNRRSCDNNDLNAQTNSHTLLKQCRELHVEQMLSPSSLVV